VERPILAVDVDGVISLFGSEDEPDRSQVSFEVVDGVLHRISLPAGARLRTLGEHFELVWASGWERRANDYLLDVLGLPALPYLRFAGAARFGSADWKLGPLDEYAGRRPLAWIDDSFDESCYVWARGRGAPTLLIPTESHLGLEDVHVEALVAWAGGL